MLKTIRVKLLPTQDQKKILLDTMKVVNTACNSISEFAFQNNVFNRFELQKQMYRSIRSVHGLGAQITILACRKVADSYRASIKKEKSSRSTPIAPGCDCLRQPGLLDSGHLVSL